jgi:hypothetical protein
VRLFEDLADIDMQCFMQDRSNTCWEWRRR